MAYLNIQTGAYPLSAADVRAAHPNTSFPGPADEFEACLPDFGYAVVQPTPKPTADHTKNVTEGPPVDAAGTYNQAWVVTDASTAEIAERTDAQARNVRADRNDRLASCDWTQLADAPGQTRSAYVQYRQDLRNVPQQPGFPWNVTWPVAP